MGAVWQQVCTNFNSHSSPCLRGCRPPISFIWRYHHPPPSTIPPSLRNHPHIPAQPHTPITTTTTPSLTHCLSLTPLSYRYDTRIHIPPPTHTHTHARALTHTHTVSPPLLSHTGRAHTYTHIPPPTHCLPFPLPQLGKAHGRADVEQHGSLLLGTAPLLYRDLHASLNRTVNLTASPGDRCQR